MIAGLREAVSEMLADLPHAVFTATAVGLFTAMIAIWSGWFTGALG